MAVVDASVAGALLAPHEPGHARSRQWWDAAIGAGEVVHAPALLLSELASAVRTGGGDGAAAAAWLREVEGFDAIDVTVELASRAAEIVATSGLHGCDAIYVALAERLRTELVTLDKQQRERGASFVPTREP